MGWERKLARRMWLGLAMVLLCSVSALAQGGRGVVAGTVMDAEGGSLQGATITLKPTGATAQTSATGQFSIVGVPAGEYDVTVAYSGFETYKAEVDVKAGEVAHITAALKVAAAQSNVQVYAGREGGEVEAINRTTSADNIINVLPADVIRSLPNANVADAIGRLPSVTLERDEGEGKYVQVRGTEPRLTNTTVDGVNIASAETVREVKLDIIPADLVESVQINKTLQANMPGDGIGGSVDLRTRSAESRPTIQLEGTGGHTNILGGRPAYQLDGTVGRRFMSDRLGLLGGVSYDWNGRGINDVEPGPIFLGGYDERDYRYYRSRFGVAGTVDLQAGSSSSVYLKYLYSLFHNYGDRWDYNFGTSFDANYQPVAGSGSMSFGAQIRRPVQDLGSVQLGGNHVLGSYTLHWDVESSVGRTRDKGYSDASFDNNNSYSFALDNSNPLEPKLKAQGGANVYDATQYSLSGLRINNYYSPEVDLGFGGSAARSYSAGGHASVLEIGGRFRSLHKFANQDTLFRVPAAAAGSSQLLLSNLLSNFADPGYYGGDYTWGPAASFDRILKLPFVAAGRADQIGNNFNYFEKVAAGYVMDIINLSRWRLVGGVRFEGTTQRDTGTTTSGDAVAARSGSHVDVLPSVSARYAVRPTAGLRFVYSRGLSRPNFSDLVSFATVSPGGVRTTSSIGNPNLKPEHADNADVLYEQNLKPIGLVQGGLFYKRLSDPIVPVSTTVNGNTTTMPGNAGSAWVWGLEVGYQQHFGFLPGALSGLGLSANYSYTASRVDFGANNGMGRNDHPALLRQAPHTWNLSPTYDKRGLSMRLGLTYNAANVFSYSSGFDGPFDPTSGSGGGVSGPNGDTYLYSHLQVDVQGTYKLPKGFSVVGYGLNLNNEVFGFYNGNPNNTIQREYYQPTLGGGLRWSPVRE